MAGGDFMLQREWLERLRREVLREVIETAQVLATSLIDKERMVYGDVELTDEETVQKVAEARRGGLLAALRGVAPGEARRWVSEAGRAVERLDKEGA